MTTTKTVHSAGTTANVYKFVSVDKLLQIEAGITRNEPTQLAVRQAIDLAVYATIMEGTKAGIWSFADPTAGKTLVQDYIARDNSGAAATTAVASSVPTKKLY